MGEFSLWMWYITRGQINHDHKNMAASISSGFFKTDGMIIAPCTIKTLSGVAHSYNANLIIRAANVVLKERRRLILLIRETLLHKGHLEMLLRVASLAGIILPPIPAFYQHPKHFEDTIDHSIGKLLDLLNMEHTWILRCNIACQNPLRRSS